MSLRGLAGSVVVAGAMLVGAAVAPAAHAATWCGGTPAAADRMPDAVGGNQYHVVYAVPSDGVDRFADRASGIVSDLAFVDRWWRLQDATRTPRFDVLDVACDSELGRLDLSSIRLALPASAFVRPDTRTTQLRSALSLVAPNAGKAILVYYESPIPLDGDICGQGGNGAAAAGAPGFAAVYIAPNLYGSPGCGTVGGADYMAIVAAHELVHSLGALPSGAPHPCPGDDGHPCDSQSDVLFSGGYCCLFDRQLDYGRDDYYGHSGAWWDTRNSLWLVHLDRPRFPLVVRLAGDVGESSVDSDVPGIACPTGCSVPYDADAAVTLTANAGIGRELVRWEGDCAGVNCTVQMGAPRSVTAVFARQKFRLAVVVRGKGLVSSQPRGLIACPRKCVTAFAYGTPVTLTARPAPHMRFAGWRGDCSGPGRCTVEEDAQVTARFVRKK